MSKMNTITEKVESEIRLAKVFDEDEYSFICRTDSNADCNEHECPFCKLTRCTDVNYWYARCGLYNQRLKQYKNLDIAICCDECIHKFPKLIQSQWSGEVK